jgi:hypothetical protein
VPGAGENSGVATAAALMEYNPDCIVEFDIPDFTAIAFSVVVLVIATGDEYTGEVVVGFVPSTV